jgi:molybdopterin synthase catalytic subunit
MPTPSAGARVGAVSDSHDTEDTPRAGHAVRLVALRETALDVTEVLDALDDDASGGLTLFVGRVRDHDGGKGVDGLDYSAHPSALEKLQEVCDRVAAEHDVTGVAAVHRVGTLDIGDIAVVVATTAAHRGEAFVASRALIDTLKAEVPIWKHQRFGDGTEEWVGAP